MKSLKMFYKLAGLSYLGIFITGFFANFMVMETLFSNQMPSELEQTLMENKDLYQWGLASFALMVFFDLILVRVLFPLFKERSIPYRFVTHGFRLIHALLFIWGLIPLFQLMGTIPDGGNALEAYELFTERWDWGLLFFGGHLLLLSGLLWRDMSPKWITLLMGIAGIGYLVDSGARLFYEEYESIANVLALVVLLPGIAGELSFTLWLLRKGFRKVITK